jgi:hypothetical protein
MAKTQVTAEMVKAGVDALVRVEPGRPRRSLEPIVRSVLEAAMAHLPPPDNSQEKPRIRTFLPYFSKGL